MLRNSLVFSILLICAAVAADNGQDVERRSDGTKNTEEAPRIFWQLTRDPRLTLDDVRKIIDEFECFRQMPDRLGTNPFTKESVVFSGDGKAIYIDGGEAIGNFVLEDGRVLFTGVPETIVREVAELISGTIQPWDSS
jgi:hypothetical protein